MTKIHAGEHVTFNLIRNPDIKLLADVYAHSGENCLLNPSVLQGYLDKGTTLLALIVSRAGRLLAFGIARESGYWFARRLIFSVLPCFVDNSEGVVGCFWDGLKEYCKKRWIWKLDLKAFNSSPIEVPNLSPFVTFTRRREFVLDLAEVSKRGMEKLASNHRRNIRKGEWAGLSFQIKNNFEACKDHVQMIAHSMNRRDKRGESVHSGTSAKNWFAYIQHGAGSIMQAMLDNTCMSSVLILKTPRQAYYVSGGTCPEGMKVGASHFLIWKVIQYLSDTGVLTLSLGGVTEHDTYGLERFKAGFGAKAVALPHRSFIIGSRWKHRAIKAIAGLKKSITAYHH